MTLVMIPVVFDTGKPGVAVLMERDEHPGEPLNGETVSSDILSLLDDQMEYVVRQTAEGITRYVNETYCHAVGKSREELVGRPFKPLVSPEDADRIRAHHASLTVQYPVRNNRVPGCHGEWRVAVRSAGRTGPVQRARGTGCCQFLWS